MKNQRILLIAKPWLAVALVLALLPVVGIAGDSPDLDKTLFEAAERGDLALVKTLLDKGSDVEAYGSEAYTPLIIVADEGHEHA